MTPLDRPSYHFIPPANWVNDPNGLIYWKGTYHLFYQYNPYAPEHGNIHWGHAISADLVHWEHQPIALAPTPGGPDEDGCWSGVTVDDHGRPVVIYSGNRQRQQRCCLAFSSDDLKTLQKFPGNPVIPHPPAGYRLSEYRDHCVWWDESTSADGGWNMLMGAGIEGEGGAAFLYRSPDLVHWQAIGPILTGSIAESGLMWECPDLIPFGDKHALVISVIAPGSKNFSGYFWGCYRNSKFFPERFVCLDLGEKGYYAPLSFVNDKKERIQMGWITEARGQEAVDEAGWSGLISLPRLLGVCSDGRMSIRPYPAIEVLRGNASRRHNIQIANETRLVAQGQALEISAIFSARSTARRFGLKVLCSPDHAEETVIVYDAENRQLMVQREKSSLDTRCERHTLSGIIEIDEGEDLRLRVFIDHSAIEIFINDRQTLTCRAYPTREDAVNVEVFAEEKAAMVDTLNIWEMRSIW